MKKYKFLEHTADVKFQAFGKSLEEVFKNSALAMCNVMYEGKVKSKKNFKITVKGDDFESLLYNFLEEFLLLFDSKNFFLSKIDKIKIDKKNFKLGAEILGDSTENYEMSTYVKAITYNEMFVKKIKNKWIAQVVIDI